MLLEDILESNEGTSLSVIFPVHRLPEENVRYLKKAQKILHAAYFHLKQSYPEEIADNLHKKLEVLFNKLDAMHHKEGIGLYVSPSKMFSVKFPFPVKPKIFIGNFFALSELLLLMEYKKDYFVLELNKKKVRLFNGQADELSEMKDPPFPEIQENFYEYARPSRGNSYMGSAIVQSYEGDKSIVEATRLKNFFTGIDKALEPYLSKGDSLIIAGAEKDLALFKNSSEYTSSIIAQISGNYEYEPLQHLADMAWKHRKEFLTGERLKRISLYEEKIGEGLGAEGWAEVSRAVDTGRGLWLLIEKDYGLSHEEITDYHFANTLTVTAFSAANALIKAVLDKGGRVSIYENGELKSHSGIALIMRY